MIIYLFIYLFVPFGQGMNKTKMVKERKNT
jgi:hypothetical protein